MASTDASWYMRLADLLFVGGCALFFAIGVVSLVNFLSGPEQTCRTATIELAGLQACRSHQHCELSEYELARHYTAFRDTLMLCAAEEMSDLFNQADEMMEEEGENDDGA